MSGGGPLRPRPPARALGGPLVHFDVTGSTNDHARTLALGGAPHGTLVLAEEQRAGRGRHGRTWSAPRGRALTLSVELRPPPDAFGLLPLATAVAVCEAAEAVASVRCSIKWPNDVLVEDRKLSGILIESRPQDGWAVVGIGFNVDTPADELAPDIRGTAISLRIATGASVDRDRALDELLERLARWSTASKAEVLAAYRARDALRDERITWSGDRRGTAAGIDDDGNLVVFADSGERETLDAGEVQLVRNELSARRRR
jgi:BirA family biotin operon repressor/biotin-[acetyl-CoA-carboxylase] ligase